MDQKTEKYAQSENIVSVLVLQHLTPTLLSRYGFSYISHTAVLMCCEI